MKVLIVLALAVAVASAGFSGSFRQQADPIVQQLVSKLRLDLAKVPARSSVEAGFQTDFVNALNNHVTDILNQVDSAVDTVSAVAQTVVSHFHSAVSQLQALGQSAVESGQAIVNNLVSGLFGLFGKGRSYRALPDFLKPIVHQVATNPTFVALVRNSATYKCLKDNGLTVTFEYVQALSQNNQINADLLNDPVIAHCIEQAGGLVPLIQGSEIVDWVQNFIQPLGLTSVAHQIIIQVVGEVLGAEIIAAMQNNGRAVPDYLKPIIQSVATNPQFVSLVHNSASYQCLKDNGMTVTFELVQQLSQAGFINADLLEDPVIKHCIEQAGGLVALIQGSEVVDWVQSFIQPLGLTNAVHQIIIQVVGEVLGGEIIAAMQGRNMNSRAIPDFLKPIVHQVATNPQFVSLVHNSVTYKCLKDNGLTVTFEYVQQLSQNNQINADLLNDPIIAHCLEQAGGLENLLAGSQIVDWVQGFVGQTAGLTSIIHQIIIEVAGEELGNIIISAINARGFFGDVFNTIGDVAGNVWDGISGAASNAWNGLTSSVANVGQYISNLATATFQSAAEKFEIIKQLAVAFLQGAITTAHFATQQAAQEFLNTLGEYASDLGQMWFGVVEQMTAIWDGLTIPTWTSRQAIRV